MAADHRDSYCIWHDRATSPGTLFPTDTALSIYPSSSGRPVPGLELKILDDDGHEGMRRELSEQFISVELM